jgi:hypothetical protein
VESEEAAVNLATSPVPPWDQREAERQLAELRAEVARIQSGFDPMPAPLANVLADALDIANGYVCDHAREAARGWDAQALLRGMIAQVRRYAENAKGAMTPPTGQQDCPVARDW